MNPSLVLVQPRNTRPYIAERLLMGRKGSNKTKHERKHFDTNHAAMTVDTMSKLKTCVEETKKGRPSACGRSQSENIDVGSCILALALAMFVLQRKKLYHIRGQCPRTAIHMTSHVTCSLTL